MSIVILFLIAGFILIYLIARYEKKNSNKVEDILRANKNVPPLFMLRSAELKVNAIRAALNNPALALSGEDEVQRMQKEFTRLVTGYKDREITLATYYSKLGALLISINELKGIPAEAQLS
ncbi:MAG: hypothetical protein ACXVB0_24860 [Mucilaginibacter sp.]